MFPFDDVIMIKPLKWHEVLRGLVHDRRYERTGIPGILVWNARDILYCNSPLFQSDIRCSVSYRWQAGWIVLAMSPINNVFTCLQGTWILPRNIPTKQCKSLNLCSKLQKGICPSNICIYSEDGIFFMETVLRNFHKWNVFFSIYFHIQRYMYMYALDNMLISGHIYKLLS